MPKAVRHDREDPNSPPLGEVLEFMHIVWSLYHSLQAASKRMSATLGVTGPQRLAIRIVGKFPNLPAGQLAKILRVHPSTLTGILDRLEKRRFIERRSNVDDGRSTRLRLTASGRAMDGRRSGTVEAAIKSALAGLPESQLDAARAVLGALTASLEHQGPGRRSARTRHRT